MAFRSLLMICVVASEFKLFAASTKYNLALRKSLIPFGLLARRPTMTSENRAAIHMTMPISVASRCNNLLSQLCLTTRNYCVYVNCYCATSSPVLLRVLPISHHSRSVVSASQPSSASPPHSDGGGSEISGNPSQMLDALSLTDVPLR